MGSHAGGSGISGIDTVRLGHDINRIKQLFGYEQVTNADKKLNAEHGWMDVLHFFVISLHQRMIVFHNPAGDFPDSVN